MYAWEGTHAHPSSKPVEMLKLKAALGQNALLLSLCFLCIAPSVNGTGAGEWFGVGCAWQCEAGFRSKLLCAFLSHTAYAKPRAGLTRLY